MKTYGVKVGEPVWEAKQKCPDGVYVKRDFRWYETLSRKMLAEVGTFSPKVEYYSIDEFFWEGTGPRPELPADRRDMSAITSSGSAGLPMTVAFARTRTLAKLFADTAKPFGAVAVRRSRPRNGTPRANSLSPRSPVLPAPCGTARTLRHQDLSRFAEGQRAARQEIC